MTRERLVPTYVQGARRNMMRIGVDFSNDPIAAHTERNSEDLDFRLHLEGTAIGR